MWEKTLKLIPPQQRICAVLIISFGAIVFGVKGCALVGKPAADKIAEVVTAYCESETYEARKLYRNTINDSLRLAGHSVQVSCAGDPE